MEEETGARWNEKLEGQEERQTEEIKQEGGRRGRLDVWYVGGGTEKTVG